MSTIFHLSPRQLKEVKTHKAILVALPDEDAKLDVPQEWIQRKTKKTVWVTVNFRETDDPALAHWLGHIVQGERDPSLLSLSVNVTVVTLALPETDQKYLIKKIRWPQSVTINGRNFP